VPLQKLQFRPGVIKDVPAYTSTGGWYDCNLVRFRNGFPQPIGGWQKYADTQFNGICRDLIAWIALSGTDYIGLGTTTKYYLESGGSLVDITPIRDIETLTNPFAATNGSYVLTVTDIAHGCLDGDYVTFSGATSLGGNVTAAVLNREYTVTEVLSANTYTVTMSVAANSSDSGGGGTVTAAYQINIGLDTQVGGVGWGAGTWGLGTWGTARTISTGNSLRLWSSDNFGQDLFFCVRDGGIYYWSPTLGASARGIPLNDATLTSDPACPSIGTMVRTSDQQRHLIVFGGNNYFNNDGTINNSQDPLLVKWSDQEDFTVWSPSATNSAGDFRLGSGTKIIHAVETKREFLIWTDTALYSMQYLGPPYTYGINQIASNTTALGFNSFCNVEDVVYWMGNGKFYVYDGRTQELPCPVLKHVFNNFNYQQSDKLFAAVNSKFNEVTWFYPSANSFENDVYVTYNYAEKAWTYGNLARTAWVDSGANIYPIAASVDSYLYNHEFGLDDGSTNPPTPLVTYIESAPIEIGSGDQFSFIKKIIPDVGFYESTSGSPTVTMTLKTQNFPGANYINTTNSSISQTATIPIEQFTEQAFVRLRGRQLSFRISGEQVGTFWVLGTPRIEIQPDGKR
jgi:hypothetical protein